MLKTIIARINIKDGKVPDWMLLFEDGWTEVEGEGKYLVDSISYKMLSAYIAKRGIDIVFDYEHQTIKGAKAPASGWIKEYRYTKGRGIEARVEWTEEAAGYILKKEYRYFSQVFGVRKTDQRIVALHSVALTNSPKTNNLTPILAKLGEDFTNKEEGMDFFKKLFKALELADGAKEDDVLTAVAKLDEKAKNPDVKEVVAKDVLDALDLKEESDTSTVVASIHALKQSDKTGVSREEFNKVTKQLADRDAQEVVAKAGAEGKITPDQTKWATEYATRDLEGFKTFIAKAPVVVPVNKLPEKKETTDDITADETVMAVAKMMDVSAEDIKKYA
jgi:phage I-like protein